MILSTYANRTVAEVSEPLLAVNQALGQQLSKVVDESINDQILNRAQQAGAKAVYLTIDCPWLGRRLRDVRCNFALPPGMPFPSFPADLDGLLGAGNSCDRTRYDASLTWTSLRSFKDRAHSRGLQLWLKGVLSSEDANLGVQAGVDGILVSNHGGCQLDDALSTLDALPGVVAAVQGRIPVHLDGGIRRGSDIFKALALGAEHVWIGGSLSRLAQRLKYYRTWRVDIDVGDCAQVGQCSGGWRTRASKALNSYCGCFETSLRRSWR